MGPSEVQAGDALQRLTELVDAYSRRVYAPVLGQHPSASVSSPLGIWLLLAACASAARGPELTELEAALGCPAAEASRLLAGFVATPPPALKAAVAVWAAAGDATPELAEWVRGLPDAVESGFMPTQAEADAWARRSTLGLIKTFPAAIDRGTRVVLASALATKVSWQTPFDVVPADGHLGPASPWRSQLRRLLWDSHPDSHSMIATTHAAGLVAVHLAVAREDLTVISVSADP